MQHVAEAAAGKAWIEHLRLHVRCRFGFHIHLHRLIGRAAAVFGGGCRGVMPAFGMRQLGEAVDPPVVRHHALHLAHGRQDLFAFGRQARRQGFRAAVDDMDIRVRGQRFQIAQHRPEPR
ncbi:hypothetical protein D3C81_1945210 [compost metagenome]